jgi:(4S)-4-hydroxy-5-phosphonooxypentane-2,3-dione isomerase
MHVVTVTFQIKADHRAAFMERMLENARESLARETACRQFDVCVSSNDACSVFLYEVYDNKEAFAAHLAEAHFIEFNRVTQDWVTSKSVMEFERCA